MIRLPHSSMCAKLVAMALCLAAPSAFAAPDFSSDVITRLLIDKGLVDTPVFDRATATIAMAGPSLGQQVRSTTSDLVLSAMTLLGVPYRHGGDSVETGFDCSGFTRHIFESSLGLLLPRRADEQAKASTLVPVKRDDLKPGDLVFFNTLKRTFSHVGIYVGDGKFIHAPRSGGEIRVESMGVKYWAKRFTGARRAPQASAATVIPASNRQADTTSLAPLQVQPAGSSLALPENASVN